MAKRLMCLCGVILALAGAFHLGLQSGNASTVSHSQMTWVVTSAADLGPATLRQQLASAGNGDTIAFDPGAFPPASPISIYLISQLPDMAQGNLTIDARNAGVILDGSGATTGAVGLVVASDSNTISGLQILHFPGEGILVTSIADSNTIEANVISANGGLAGVGILGSGNTVHGNFIGTDASGTVAMANDNHGIYIGDAPGNYIGPGNTIAHNGGAGIMVEGNLATRNTVTQNSITQNTVRGIQLLEGGNAELAAPIISACSDTSISGTAPAGCTIEVFSDSDDQGVVYEGATVSDGTGTFSFTKPGGLTGPYITATATDSTGNTSEFSPGASAATQPTTWGQIKAEFGE